jgi:hypothetical protein
VFGSKRLDELEEEIRKVKRMVEERDLDWVDMRSRCKRLLDRTEKAAKLAVTREPNEEPAPPEASTSQGRLLTSRQMEVQQQILKRRGAGGSNGLLPG